MHMRHVTYMMRLADEVSDDAYIQCTSCKMRVRTQHDVNTAHELHEAYRV